MKHMFRLYIIFLALVSSHCIQTRIGCLDKSKHLKEAFDTKNYHPVACDCPCDAYHAKGKFNSMRNQCLQCGHFHDPQPLILVTKIVQTKTNSLPTNPHTALQLLINQYRAKHHPTNFDK